MKIKHYLRITSKKNLTTLMLGFFIIIFLHSIPFVSATTTDSDVEKILKSFRPNLIPNCKFPTPKTKAHIAYPLGDNIILDGKNFSYGNFETASLSDDSIIFVRPGGLNKTKNADRIMLNGREIARGSRPVVDGNHFAYRGIDGTLYVDKKSVGKGARILISDNHYAFEFQDEMLYKKSRLIYDGKDLGEGLFWESISGNHVIYEKYDELDRPIITYDGKNLGIGSEPVVFNKSLAYITGAGHRNPNGTIDYNDSVIFNGKKYSLSTPINLFEPLLSDSHILWEQMVGIQNHIFVDGKDVGEGKYPSLSGDHYAFEQNGKIVYDGKIIAGGFRPTVFEDHIAFTHNGGYMTLDCKSIGYSNPEGTLQPKISRYTKPLLPSEAELKRIEARDLQWYDIQQISGALNFYFDENSLYPASLKKLMPKHIPSDPRKMLVNFNYEYKSKNNGADYELCIPLSRIAKKQCVSNKSDVFNITEIF